MVVTVTIVLDSDPGYHGVQWLVVTDIVPDLGPARRRVIHSGPGPEAGASGHYCRVGRTHRGPGYPRCSLSYRRVSLGALTHQGPGYPVSDWRSLSDYHRRVGPE